jgi:hypothetical protein
MPLRAKHRIPESQASWSRPNGHIKSVIVGDLTSEVLELAAFESERTVGRGWINPPESNPHE